MTTRSAFDKALEPRQPAGQRTNGNRTAPAPKPDNRPVRTPAAQAPTQAAADKAKAAAKQPAGPARAATAPAPAANNSEPPKQPTPGSDPANGFVTADKLPRSPPEAPQANAQPSAPAPAATPQPPAQAAPEAPQAPTKPASDEAKLSALFDMGLPGLRKALKHYLLMLDKVRLEAHKTYDEREEAYHTWKKKEAELFKAGVTQGTNEQDRRSKAYLSLQEEITDHKILMINEDMDKTTIARLQDRIQLIYKLIDLAAQDARESGDQAKFIDAKAEAIYNLRWGDVIREEPTYSHHMPPWADFGGDKGPYLDQAKKMLEGAEP